MRHGPFIAGLIALTAAAHAEPRSAYVTMVLQAFAAKVECPGMDIVYQDLVQKAQEMNLPDGTTEKVRKAFAYMHTAGRMASARMTTRCRKSPWQHGQRTSTRIISA
jgi:hypothetical protein